MLPHQADTDLHGFGCSRQVINTPQQLKHFLPIYSLSKRPRLAKLAVHREPKEGRLQCNTQGSAVYAKS